MVIILCHSHTFSLLVGGKQYTVYETCFSGNVSYVYSFKECAQCITWSVQ